MSQGIPDTVLARLSAVLTAVMGLRFPQERWRNLETGIEHAAREFGFEDTAACIDWLMTANLTRRQVETLAAFLTVGETYFFREPRSLEAFEHEIVPGLVRSRRGKEQVLRIWSAGCSTGEEPYTIAILLHRLLPGLADWNVTILATDIDAVALRKAADGVYGEWSFRAAPPWLKGLYFAERGKGSFELSPRIRAMVSFAYLNLAEDSYPSLPTNTNAMDVIFCRNVLMYFAPELALDVVGKLRRSLVDNGWLIVSPAEASQPLFPSFEAIDFPEATLYRKQGAVAGGEEPAISAPEPLPPVPRFPPPEPEPRPQAPGPRPTPLDLVRGCANQGKLAEALDCCDKALAADKMNPDLHYLRALICQELGIVDETRASLKKALYLDPNLVLVHFALGNLALREGKATEARRYFENASALLSGVPPDHILPYAEGMTAGRLREIIRFMPVFGGVAEKPAPVEKGSRRR